MNIKKIDSYSETDNDTTLSTMKPNYGTNEELNCGTINYGDKTYYVDHKDKDRIINFNKNFIFINNDDDYPSYSHNYKRFTYLDFIFNYNSENVCYVFKNNNKYDLRCCNVETYHSYHQIVSQNYNIIEYIKGHFKNIGQNANIMKNPLWRVTENDKEYLLMYCEKDTICKLCPESYQKILDYEKTINKKLTFFKCSNGYIQAHIPGEKILYIHQIITGCYGNGQGTKNISVDHIDQNPLNNEWLNKEHTKKREFFKIEKHPKLDKPWSTTKSNKVTIQEKLNQANKVAEDLDNDIYPEKDDAKLPKYVSLIIAREKPHLVFEKRMDGKRLGLKMVLPEEYDLQEQLEKLNEKVKEKYDIEI
jgi:hypothetical protein